MLLTSYSPSPPSRSRDRRREGKGGEDEGWEEEEEDLWEMECNGQLCIVNRDAVTSDLVQFFVASVNV